LAQLHTLFDLQEIVGNTSFHVMSWRKTNAFLVFKRLRQMTISSIEKWRNLILLVTAEILIFSLWFSGSAILPQMTEEWQLSGADQAWMTMSVQVGFVIGAFLSALLNLPDRIPASRLIVASA